MKIFIKAKPLAKNESLEKIDDTHFVVAVREPPKEGRANNAVVMALAEYFGVAPSRVRLIAGFSSRKKVFEIMVK